ncbi:MAG: UbiD family decarboxylase [Leptospiraceae bacterium]|nr:UbiD family decarboxylase [Leptospiraceae bacterium]MDW7976430.1 UbiD family decarboxylase [Leptospiraceae bacterium]
MFSSLLDCVLFLERHNQLVRIKEEIDPNLEMAIVHEILFLQKGPAIFYENIKNTKFPAISNLFGTYERAKLIFRNTLPKVKKLIELRAKPEVIRLKPFSYWDVPFTVLNTIPRKVKRPKVMENETRISQLPLIKNWQKDGGAFITLPIVLSYDVQNPSIMKTNLGMYRVQLNGNQYKPDLEIGLHYQIHRGIGVHHYEAIKHKKPFKVSIFVGGPPAHTFAAVMPLPEGLPEVAFAGALAGRPFRYARYNDYFISADADFCIVGEVQDYLLPEGPFGDHLGYYSLRHPFPVVKVEKVFHRNDAIWPFTVVGRPPQEDTIFGKIIHELTGDMIPVSLPGVRKVHAVDESGVHPLLLAVGSERYLPYLPKERQQPMEILTQANAILGFNQLSLAKYLWIVAEDKDVPDIHSVEEFFQYVLERIDFERDFHFITNTTIDTLDYTSSKLNIGSKVIFAATNPQKRNLSYRDDSKLNKLNLKESGILDLDWVSKGILAVKINPYKKEDEGIKKLINYIEKNYEAFKRIGLIVLCDDVKFVAKNFSNFLWVTFTRSNPATDIYGPFSFIKDKHWGCKNPLIIDARKKPYLPPELEIDKKTLFKVKRFFEKGKSLEKFEFINLLEL